MKIQKIFLTAAFMVLIVGVVSASIKIDSKLDGQDSITKTKKDNKAILISIPLGFFYSDRIEKLIPDVTYLRTFGIDFKRPKVDGQFQYVDEERVDDFIQFTNKKHIKVVWTLNVGTKTLETELKYVKHLLEKGMNICAFEYGGEFYLPKYARNDTLKKGVVERITPSIYIDLLKNWLPVFIKLLPPSKGDHIIIGASHGGTHNKRDKYRKEWNLKIVQGIKTHLSEYANQLSWSFHLYAGRRAIQSPKGEEDVVNTLNFGFMHDFPEHAKIYVTESGYYVNSFTTKELQKSWRFWSAVYQHLRPGDVYGVHPLICKSKRKNPLCLYSLDGQLTPIGQKFKEWIKQRNDY